MRKPLVKTPTLGTQGGVMGRGRKLAPAYKAWPIRDEPPENVQEFIALRAAEGASFTLIAHELGTSDEVLRRWMNDDYNLRWAYKVGRAKDEAFWVSLLRRDALDAEKPNLNALSVLNSRHQWRKETEDSGPRVSITFNLPGAQTREDFMRSIVPADGET